MAVDPRVQELAFDAAVASKVNEKLAEAGIRGPNDLALGRADMGRVAALMQEAEFVNQEGGVQINPLIADKIIRNDDYFRQATGSEQPVPPAPPDTSAPETQAGAPDDRLAAAQVEAEKARAEVEEWKKRYGERENKLGEERRKTAERLARLESMSQGNYAPAQAPHYSAPSVAYDPRILGDRDPNVPLSAGETASLLQNMAMAFGQQLSVRDQALIDAARNLRNYDLTPNEEADLIEKHGWLASLDRSSQISAMRDLVPSIRPQTPVAPAGQIKPPQVNMQELARARVRTATTFIEPSSQGSPQESAAASGINSDYAKKTARIRELLSTPGGAEEAERLINELSARRR